MAYTRLFSTNEEDNTKKKTKGYTRLFSDQGNVPLVNINPLVPEQKSTNPTDYLFKDLKTEKEKSANTEIQNKLNTQKGILDNLQNTSGPTIKQFNGDIVDRQEEPLWRKAAKLALPKKAEDAFGLNEPMPEKTITQRLQERETANQVYLRDKKFKELLNKEIKESPKIPSDYKEPDSFLGQVVEGVEAGWKSTVVPSIGYFAESTGMKIGSPSMIKWGQEFGDKMTIEYLKHPELAAPEDMKGLFDGGATDPRNYGRIIGETIPFIGTVLGLSVAGGLIGGPTGVAMGAFGSVAAIEQGNAYKAMLDAGVAPDKATEASAIYGVVSGAIENMFGYIPAKIAGKILTKESKTAVSNSLKSYLIKDLPKMVATMGRKSLEEGGEEVAQQLAQDILTKWAGSEEGMSSFKELAEQFAAGAIGSLPFGVSEIKSPSLAKEPSENFKGTPITPKDVAPEKVKINVESEDIAPIKVDVAPKEEETIKEVVPEIIPESTKTIPELETELSTKYKESSKNIDEELANIYTEFELAEAGERIMTEEGSFIGKPSSFPDYIPEHLRDKKLFDNVIDRIYDIESLKYPEANKTRQRELYNYILDELDSRLNVDTKDIRTKILDQYEQNKGTKKEKIPGAISSSTTRGVRQSEEQKRQKQVRVEFPTFEQYYKLTGGYKAVSQGMDTRGDYISGVIETLKGEKTDLGKVSKKIIDETRKLIEQHSFNKERDTKRLEDAIKKSEKKPSAKEGMRGNEREKEGKQKTLTGEEVAPEKKPAEQGGLNLKPEKDAMDKKIKPAVSSEDYIKAKEEELKNKAEGLDELPMFQELSSYAKTLESYNGFELTLDDAVKLFRKLFSVDEMNFAFADYIKMKGGKSAKGRFVPNDRYSQNFLSLVELLNKNGKVSEQALYHEAFHAYFYTFVSKEERQRIINIVKNSKTTSIRRKKLEESYEGDQTLAEEWIANDFARYVADKNGIKHKGLTGFFNKMLNHLISLVRKKATLDKIYEDILTKKRPEEKAISGEEVAKEAKEMGSDQGGLSDYTLDKIREEDYLVKKLSIEELRKSDLDLNDYLKTAEVREYEGEPFAMYPIVSSKGEVLDGYNRIAQLVEYDKKTVTVFYGVDNAKYQELSNEDALIEEARKYKSAEEFVIVMKIKHRPPDSEGGSPLNDLEMMFPDIYSVKGDRYYASYGMAGEKQAMEIIREMKDKPDADITIYRSVNPDEKTTINAGDWVTIVKDYARQHGESNLEKGYKIVSKKVKASDIFNDGNSIVEWGYRPEGHKDFTRAELTDIWNKANETKYQELGESTKLPDIQLKKDVITKDMQGNRITLSEGDVFSVYELPKNKYFLEGKESYTVLKNVFQNIKGQSIIAEKKEFAPELEGTEETIKGSITVSRERAKAKKFLKDNGITLEKDMSGDVLLKKGDDYLDYDELTDKQRKAYDVYIGEAESFDDIDGTKFEQYVLPNGENYREILVQAKKSQASIIQEKVKNLESLVKEKQNDIDRLNAGLKYDNNYERDYLTKKEIRGRIKSEKEKLENLSTSLSLLMESEEYQKYKDVKVSTQPDYYYRPHWDEPNVLFHLRMNERKYNGKNVSFMEEFQSDWAREARDKGFINPERAKLQEEFETLQKEFVEKHGRDWWGKTEEVDKTKLNRWNELVNILDKMPESKIPYSPLLKNWQVTAIKRALIESVNSDYFAWTNGEQQKARYNLSDKVDNIEWFTKNKEKGISIRLLNKKSVDIYVDENGKIIKSDKKDWKGENLQNAIGKGLSEKIMEKDDGMLSGIDLDVGGEWANSLYDIQAKKIVESLTGGKVEYIDMGLSNDIESAKWSINVGTPEAKFANENDLYIGRKMYLDGDGYYIVTNVLGNGKFKAKPFSVMGSPNSSLYEQIFDISEETVKQPALKLTPEIKAIIKGEAPQLKVEQKLYQTPSQGGKMLFEALNRISTDEALEQAQDFAIVRENKIPITAVEAIKENPQALGKYVDKTIEFVYNPDVTTMPHEVGHYWFNTLLTREQQNEVLAEYKAWLNKNKREVPDTRSSLEESLMQDMAEHYVKEYQSKSKIERFFDWIIYQIKQVLRQNNFISQFTYNVRTKTSINKNDIFKKTDIFDKILLKQSSPQYQMKLYEKVKGLVQKYATTVGESYLPRGALGVFYTDTKNIRVSGMNDLYVAAHELTHFLDFKYKITKDLMGTTKYSINGRPIYKKETAPIRKQITDLYIKHYPGGKKTHPLSKRAIEGFATLLQKYVQYPKTIEAQYPDLVREFLRPGGKYYNSVIGEILTDLNSIVKEYNDLGWLDKVGARVVDEKTNINKDTFLDFSEKVKTEVADEIYPVEKLAKKTGRHFTKEDASLWLRQFNNSSALIINNITGNRGYWGWRDGEFVKLKKYNWKDLIHLLEQDDASQEFAYYLVARREYFLYKELETLKSGSEEYNELNSILRNDGFTEEEVTEAYLKNKERFSGFEKIYDELVLEDLKFLNDKDVQLINDEEFRQLASQKGYASFKRSFYDEISGDEKTQLNSFRVGKTKVSSLMRRKGSQRSIISPLFSALTNHAEITRKGLKQIVYNKIGNMADDLPDLFQRQQLKVVPEKNGAFSFPQEKDSKIIMTRKNYKRVPYLVDAQIKRTVDEVLTPKNFTLFEKLVIGANRFFTKGTTGLFYGFAITNTTIDQITLAAQTRNKTIPIYDALKELTKAIDLNKKEHTYFMEYLVSGGDRQTLVGWQDMSPNELIEKINNERKGLLKVVDLINSGMDILSIPSKYSEIMTRATEYVKARQAGKPAIVAIEEAGRVTASFHHTGRLGGSQGLRTFVKSIPFLNPAIQVLAQTAETLGRKDGKKRFLFVALAVTAANLASFGLMMALGSDDQKDLYADIDPEELIKYLWFPNPDRKTLIKVRVPDQMNIIGVLANMMMSDKMLQAKYKVGDYIDGAMAWLPQQVQINRPAQAFLSWIPQIIKPGILTLAGVKDFPDVMPLESQSQKAKSPGLRFTEGTTPLAKAIGEKLNISPIKLDYLITGYFGRASGYITGKPDIFNPFKSMKREYYFTSGRKVQEFYDMKEVNDQNYYDMKHNLKKFTLKEKNSILRERTKLNVINDLLKSYNDVDEEKFPTKAEYYRTRIIKLINQL